MLMQCNLPLSKCQHGVLVSRLRLALGSGSGSHPRISLGFRCIAMPSYAWLSRSLVYRWQLLALDPAGTV
jgi:hypothetical protein